MSHIPVADRIIVLFSNNMTLTFFKMHCQTLEFFFERMIYIIQKGGVEMYKG